MIKLVGLSFPLRLCKPPRPGVVTEHKESFRKFTRNEGVCLLGNQYYKSRRGCASRLLHIIFLLYDLFIISLVQKTMENKNSKIRITEEINIDVASALCGDCGGCDSNDGCTDGGGDGDGGE